MQGRGSSYECDAVVCDHSEFPPVQVVEELHLNVGFKQGQKVF